MLVVGRFNQHAASVDNLHLLSWAMRSRRSRQLLLSRWSGRESLVPLSRRLDPALPVTLGLAVANGLIRIQGQAHRRVALSNAGAALAARIEQEESLFVIEKDFLTKLGTLSDARISRLLDGTRA